jgi:hypothetical protein
MKIFKILIYIIFVFIIGLFGYKLFFPELVKFPQQLIDMLAFLSSIAFLVVFYNETTEKKNEKDKK